VTLIPAPRGLRAGPNAPVHGGLLAPVAPRPLAVPLRAAQGSSSSDVPTDALTAVTGENAGRKIWDVRYDISDADRDQVRGWRRPLRVAVSGAAGQIANHLLFQLASGEVFGPDQPLILQLLGSERSVGALEGVTMELEDSLYPLLREVQIGIDPLEVFRGADWALLIGARPRGPGMERADLLDINGSIFVKQGQALDAVASPDCKVLVVGNPCNTNALICMENAPSLPRENFHALTRLDENRSKVQLALKAERHYNSVSRAIIWGNHSTTQVPDFVNARIGARSALEVLAESGSFKGNVAAAQAWCEDVFVPRVSTRGGALIKKWGRSSAASTSVSVCDAIRSLVTPTPRGDVFSSAVCTDNNPWGIEEGLVFSMPCVSSGDGRYRVVGPGDPDCPIEINDWLRNKIGESQDELMSERECTAHLIPNSRWAASCTLRGGNDTWVEGDA